MGYKCLLKLPILTFNIQSVISFMRCYRLELWLNCKGSVSKNHRYIYYSPNGWRQQSIQCPFIVIVMSHLLNKLLGGRASKFRSLMNFHLCVLVRLCVCRILWTSSGVPYAPQTGFSKASTHGIRHLLRDLNTTACSASHSSAMIWVASDYFDATIWFV